MAHVRAPGVHMDIIGIVISGLSLAVALVCAVISWKAYCATQPSLRVELMKANREPKNPMTTEQWFHVRVVNSSPVPVRVAEASICIDGFPLQVKFEDATALPHDLMPGYEIFVRSAEVAVVVKFLSVSNKGTVTLTAFAAMHDGRRWRSGPMKFDLDKWNYKAAHPTMNPALINQGLLGGMGPH